MFQSLPNNLGNMDSHLLGLEPAGARRQAATVTSQAVQSAAGVVLWDGGGPAFLADLQLVAGSVANYSNSNP